MKFRPGDKVKAKWSLGPELGTVVACFPLNTVEVKWEDYGHLYRYHEESLAQIYNGLDRVLNEL